MALCDAVDFIDLGFDPKLDFEGDPDEVVVTFGATLFGLLENFGFELLDGRLKVLRDFELKLREVLGRELGR